MLTVLKASGIVVALLVGLPVVMNAFSPRTEETAYEVLLTEVRCRVPGSEPSLIEFTPTSAERRSRGVGIAEFEDAAVKVEVEIMSSQMLFVIRNGTKEPLEIPWHQAGYQDSDGRMHNGLTMILFADQTSLIPPGKKEVFMGGASDIVRVSGDNFSFMPMLHPPGTIDPLSREVAKPYCDHIGKTLKLLLTMHAEGIVREYEMTFVINDIVVRAHKGDWPVGQRRWGGCNGEDFWRNAH